MPLYIQNEDEMYDEDGSPIPSHTPSTVSNNDYVLQCGNRVLELMEKHNREVRARMASREKTFREVLEPTSTSRPQLGLNPSESKRRHQYVESSSGYSNETTRSHHPRSAPHQERSISSQRGSKSLNDSFAQGHSKALSHENNSHRGRNHQRVPNAMPNVYSEEYLDIPLPSSRAILEYTDNPHQRIMTNMQDAEDEQDEIIFPPNLAKKESPDSDRKILSGSYNQREKISSGKKSFEEILFSYEKNDKSEPDRFADRRHHVRSPSPIMPQDNGCYYDPEEAEEGECSYDEWTDKAWNSDEERNIENNNRVRFGTNASYKHPHRDGGRMSNTQHLNVQKSHQSLHEDDDMVESDDTDIESEYEFEKKNLSHHKNKQYQNTNFNQENYEEEYNTIPDAKVTHHDIQDEGNDISERSSYEGIFKGTRQRNRAPSTTRFEEEANNDEDIPPVAPSSQFNYRSAFLAVLAYFTNAFWAIYQYFINNAWNFAIGVAILLVFIGLIVLSQDYKRNPQDNLKEKPIIYRYRGAMI